MKFQELRPEMAAAAAALIGEAMNPDEGTWARVTIERHFGAGLRSLERGLPFSPNCGAPDSGGE